MKEVNEPSEVIEGEHSYGIVSVSKITECITEAERYFSEHPKDITFVKVYDGYTISVTSRYRRYSIEVLLD